MFQEEKEVIALADKLFDENKYIEVYELLNRQKFEKNIDIKWRIARSLFFVLDSEKMNDSIRQNIVEEAMDILNSSLAIEDNPNIYKWLAIMTNYNSGIEGLESRIKTYPLVREHLQKACDLNPNDFCVNYMLGKLCYELANLSWLQKTIAKYFFEEPPKATYEEAYAYLVKAEELQPRCFIPNVYLLGESCVKLKMFYRAKYYLTLVINLSKEKGEQKYANKAKQIIDKLEKYDLGKDVLFCNYLNGYGFTDDV
ncbi:unnamed protein product [Brassicogethes aeneus]|uniref:Regulator of microtubule dynamics protein 1 n=1 Tax=Brassicogethes aeneus TaxID=1431903 RepID=A0A9P0BGT2_BRAAE|nr:unnamed protein product [Brassicogethes aeneus]